MTSRERISAVDAAWLHMDLPHNEMVITSMLGLGDRFGDADLDEVIARLMKHKRFHQRIAEPHRPLATASWEDMPDFDAKSHVHHATLTSPDQSALADAVSEIMSTPLDHAKPLWDLHVFDGAIRGVARGSVIVIRVHHAVADGVALVKTLLDVASSHGRPESVGLEQHHHGFGHFARRATDQAFTLGKLLLMPPDPATPLKGVQTLQKRAAWSRAFALEDVKKVATRLGATVNDVLLASTTAALATYIKRHGAWQDGLEIHGVLPVSFRTAVPAEEGNHFGLVFLALPLGTRGADDRVRAVKRRMDAIKASPEATDTFAILAASGLASASIERVVVDIFSKKGSVMITNVPGPPSRISLQGHVVDSLAVWAPIAGHIAVGLSLVSYAGEVRLGIKTDAGLVPDPDAIVMEFERDLDRLVRAGADKGIVATHA
jgi:hypothetical protein